VKEGIPALFAAAMWVVVCGCATPLCEDLSNREMTGFDVGKEYRIGVSGICGKVKDDHILVTRVISGSPADGKVREGDKIRALQYKGLGDSPDAVRKTIGTQIFRLGRDWDWHLYTTVERPSLRRGQGNTLTYDVRMPRSPESQYHFGPMGFFGKILPECIEVDHIYQGSPSDGRLQTGDQIVAVAGKPVRGDLFALFTECVDLAESKEGGGRLDLAVMRCDVARNDAGAGMRDGSKGGKAKARAPDGNNPPVPDTLPRTPVTVTLQLKVLGSYSETAPINCPKTDALITRTAEGIVARKDYGRLGTSLIALLATGEKKYIDHVGEVLHAADWAKPDIKLPLTGGSVSWHRAYRLITLCEYYLITEDKYVLPAIKTYAATIAMGQDAAGLWNHQSASPDANFGQLHGRLYGYGAINQTSIALWIGLILAKECGVDDPEVRMAVDKTYKLYSYWIERGKLPYGNHDAGEDFFTNNGTSGSIAVGFGLIGDRKGASFFSRMSAASSEEVLTGHTGPWFNIMWSGIGVNVAGPEATIAYSRKLRWLRTVTRTRDDQFLHMEAWGCNPKDFGLGSSGSTLLNLAAGRRAIRITGKGMDKSLWLDKEAAARVVSSGIIDYSSRSPEQLLELLGHELPPVRFRASQMLAIKDADVADEVMAMLAKGTREQRIGAVHAIGAMKIDAAGELMATVRNTKDDLWIRQLALRYLPAIKGAGKYTPEILAMLAGDKDYDVQGRFDEALGGALVKLTGSDPYSAGLDKDLFYKAVTKLMDHKRQEGRGHGISLLKNMPLEDLSLVADKMLYVIEDRDRTYVSYHGDAHRQAGLNILYGLNIEESLELTLNTINEKVGRGWRGRNRLAFMKTWGREAERVIPKIKEVLGDKAEEYVTIIEKSKTSRDMISLKESLKAGPATKSDGGNLRAGGRGTAGVATQESDAGDDDDERRSSGSEK
jgi:hypothetical protein